MNNSSVLPNEQEKLTNKLLDTVNFSTVDTSKIINDLDPNKDRMIKLCENSICKPVSIIFNDFLKEGKFPFDLENAHVVTVHKKGDRQCLK